jgi:hypothetical protein
MNWAISIPLFGIAVIFCRNRERMRVWTLYRMRSLGFSVDLWRWPLKDFRLYSAYWKIAPAKGWFRFPLLAGILASVLSAIFLLSAAVKSH